MDFLLKYELILRGYLKEKDIVIMSITILIFVVKTHVEPKDTNFKSKITITKKIVINLFSLFIKFIS